MERWLNLSGTRHLKWPDDVEILEPPEEAHRHNGAVGHGAHP